MRRLILAVVVASIPAVAQEELDSDTTVTVPGIQLNVKTRGPSPARGPSGTSQPPPTTVGVENFAIDCGPMNGVQPKTIKVLSPEGARAQVWSEDGSLAGQFSVPFNFEGRGNQYYRFILVAPDGVTLYDRKLEVKQFIGCAVKMKGGGPVAPPAPMPVAAGMPEADFEALLEAVNNASFSDEKTGVIALAAKGASFTVHQVGRLVDAMSFSADKIKAVDLTRRRLVDRQNAFKLLEHFTFSADKEKVQGLLK